jgi:Bacterial Ig-like domain
MNSKSLPQLAVIRAIAASLIIPLAIGVVACSDGNSSGPDNPEPHGIVISNPRLTSAAASVAAARASTDVSEESSVAYVSAEPGTYPDSTMVSIRNLSTGSPEKTLTVVNGGFDPIAIEAHAGDELELTISVPGGATTVLTLRVPSRRPPTVVRTDPAKGRVDVALNNVSVEAIFSEPIDPKTVNPTSLRLLRNGQPVSGTIRLTENGLSADFLPDGFLEPLTNYELVVTQDIRDLDGDALDASSSSIFTTGKSPCPTIPGATANSEPLTGCYIDVSGATPVLWVLVEQSGTQLTAGYGYIGGEQDFGGAQNSFGFDGKFTPSSSAGTFGTVSLVFGDLPVIDSAYPLGRIHMVIEAEVTRADASELSGRYFYVAPWFPGGVEEGAPVVLEKVAPFN